MRFLVNEKFMITFFFFWPLIVGHARNPYSNESTSKIQSNKIFLFKNIEQNAFHIIKIGLS